MSTETARERAENATDLIMSHLQTAALAKTIVPRQAIYDAILSALTPPPGHVIDDKGAWPVVYLMQEKNIYGQLNGALVIYANSDSEAVEVAKDLERPGISQRIMRAMTIYERHVEPKQAARAAAEGGANG